MASTPKKAETAPLARGDRKEGAPHAPPARVVHPGQAAAEIALAPLAFGEAARIGLVGDPGGGKSVAARYLVEEYTRRSVGWVVVVDDKDPARAQYDGQLRVDVADCIGGLDAEPRIVVLRGQTKFGRDVEPDEAARWCWSLKNRRLPSMLVLDEAKHKMLVTYGNWKSGIEWVPRTLEKGRSVGISIMWGAQFPQQICIDFFETTDVLFVFKLSGSGLSKLVERGYCSNGVELVIPTLKGYPLPLEERGEFVVLQRGAPWDGKIYRFDGAPRSVGV